MRHGRFGRHGHRVIWGGREGLLESNWTWSPDRNPTSLPPVQVGNRGSAALTSTWTAAGVTRQYL